MLHWVERRVIGALTDTLIEEMGKRAIPPIFRWLFGWLWQPFRDFAAVFHHIPNGDLAEITGLILGASFVDEMRRSIARTAKIAAALGGVALVVLALTRVRSASLAQ